MQNSQLDSLCEKLLLIAEERFGPRLVDWIFIGIEINDRPPFIKYYHESGQLAISLSQRVIGNDYELIGQLSHEICHLLHPSIEYPSLTKNPTLVINEGLSTYFSISAMTKFLNAEDLAINSFKVNSPNYYAAYLAVKELLDIEESSIKRIRYLCPRIDKVTPEHFRKANISCSDFLIGRLLTEFSKFA